MLLTHVSEWLHHSLINKGPLGMLDFSVSFVADYWFDIYYGTDTMMWVAKTKLDTTSANLQHSAKYQPTKFRPFIKLMDRLRFPDGSVFVDVGCGKGKVLLMARRYRFKKLVGIEFDHNLCQVAAGNVSIYEAKTSGRAPVEIICADILEYEIKADENVWFLYNPFDDVVMQNFLTKLERSIAEHPRKIWLIYHIPRHKKALEGRAMFARSEFHFVGGSEFQIYESE